MSKCGSQPVHLNKEETAIGIQTITTQYNTSVVVAELVVVAEGVVVIAGVVIIVLELGVGERERATV